MVATAKNGSFSMTQMYDGHSHASVPPTYILPFTAARQEYSGFNPATLTSSKRSTLPHQPAVSDFMKQTTSIAALPASIAFVDDTIIKYRTNPKSVKHNAPAPCKPSRFSVNCCSKNVRRTVEYGMDHETCCSFTPPYGSRYASSNATVFKDNVLGKKKSMASRKIRRKHKSRIYKNRKTSNSHNGTSQYISDTSLLKKNGLLVYNAFLQRVEFDMEARKKRDIATDTNGYSRGFIPSVTSTPRRRTKSFRSLKQSTTSDYFSKPSDISKKSSELPSSVKDLCPSFRSYNSQQAATKRSRRLNESILSSSKPNEQLDTAFCTNWSEFADENTAYSINMDFDSVLLNAQRKCWQKQKCQCRDRIMSSTPNQQTLGYFLPMMGQLSSVCSVDICKHEPSSSQNMASSCADNTTRATIWRPWC